MMHYKPQHTSILQKGTSSLSTSTLKTNLWLITEPSTMSLSRIMFSRFGGSMEFHFYNSDTQRQACLYWVTQFLLPGVPRRGNGYWVGAGNGEKAILLFEAIEIDRKWARILELSESTRKRMTRAQESFESVRNKNLLSPYIYFSSREILKTSYLEGIGKGWSISPFQIFYGSGPSQFVCS